MSELEDRVARALCEADNCSWEQFSGESHFRERAKVAIAAMASKSYGIAIFRNEEGRRMVYWLQLHGACDPETDVANFKPRGFLEITVGDHDGSGNLMRYVAHGDPLSLTEGDKP